jgi:2,4'-dihydroxyacetophenone dioxygenase
VPWASKGMAFKLLSADPDSGRFTILIKVDPGVHAPLHRHIGAVEAYVLEGGFHYHDAPEVRFTAGSYLLEPADSVHQPISPEGVLLLAVFHGAVEGLMPNGTSAGRIDWKWHQDTWLADMERVS